MAVISGARRAVFGLAAGWTAVGCVPDVTLMPDSSDSGLAQSDGGCLGGETRPGRQRCGMNDAGLLQEVCSAEGTWVETTSCVDPDQCKNFSARGSCALDSSAEACSNGRWIPADCRGCGIVDCASSGMGCCAGVGAFAIDTSARGFAARNDLVTAFDPAGDGVNASFAFDAADQRGIIGFDLAGPTAIQKLHVVTSVTGAARAPYVSIDSDAGASGCAYALYFDAMSIADTPFFCWGSFDYKYTTRVNVRVDSTSASTASLTVTTLRIN
jgi:hypothetical protein